MNKGKYDPWNLFGSHNRTYKLKKINVPTLCIIPLTAIICFYLSLKNDKTNWWWHKSRTSNSVYIYVLKTANSGIKLRISDH